MVFIHGFSDHINAYYNLFPTFAAAPYNITVHGFDQRGWGRSVHKHADWGLTGDTHQVESDIADFIHYVSSTIKSNGKADDAKLFLMGHSMGGGESLVYLLSEPHSFATTKMREEGVMIPISGLLLESPFIDFPPSQQPSAVLVFFARLAGKMFPHMQRVENLEPSFMCRDPKVCEDWKNDKLCHDTGTLQGLAGLIDRALQLDAVGQRKGAKEAGGLLGKLPCPVFWAHGTGDKVCDYPASKRLYERLTEDGKSDPWKRQNLLRSYEGAYHKLHAEPDGLAEQFARDAAGWITRVADGTQGGGSGANVGDTDGTAQESSAPAVDVEDSVKSKL